MRILNIVFTILAILIFNDRAFAQCVANSVTALNACLNQANAVVVISIQANIMGGTYVMKNNSTYQFVLNGYNVAGSWTGGNGSTTIDVEGIVVVLNNSGGSPNTTELNTIYSGSLQALRTAFPLELVEFSASHQNSDIMLRWVTVDEYQSKGFDLERSPDGFKWETIAFLPSTSNADANGRNVYEQRDKKPLAGRNYYRLHQFDLDSTGTYSDIRVVEVAKNTIPVHPNPVTERLYFPIPDDTQIEEILIYDQLGRLVHSENIQNRYGQTIEVAVSEWQDGFYRVLINSASESQSMTLIKSGK
jgi:hypothetical protein